MNSLSHRVLQASAAATTVTVLLVGCAQPGSDPGSEPTSPTSTAPVAIDYTAAPEQLFGGDCDELFSTADITRFLGAGAPSAVSEPFFVVVQSGGIQCYWGPTPMESGPALLSVAVLPATAVSDAPESQRCENEDNGEGAFGFCDFTIVANSLVLSGTLRTGIGSTENDAEAAVALMSETFAERAVSTTIAEPRERSDSAWPATIDCEDLEAGAAIRELVGGPDMELTQEGANPSFIPVHVNLATGHDWSRCSWQDYVGTLSGVDFVGVAVYSGGLWAKEMLTTGATPIEVEGADEAFVVPNPEPEGPIDTILVAVGSNLLSVSPAYGRSEAILPTVPKLIAALNGL